jgi:hypothetical protein
VEQQGSVEKALVTFRISMAAKEREWFRADLKDAEAPLIAPGLLKAGFILGGWGEAESWLAGMKRREIGASRPLTRSVP